MPVKRPGPRTSTPPETKAGRRCWRKSAPTKVKPSASRKRSWRRCGKESGCSARGRLRAEAARSAQCVFWRTCLPYKRAGLKRPCGRHFNGSENISSDVVSVFSLPCAARQQGKTGTTTTPTTSVKDSCGRRGRGSARGAHKRTSPPSTCAWVRVSRSGARGPGRRASSDSSLNRPASRRRWRIARPATFSATRVGVKRRSSGNATRRSATAWKGRRKPRSREAAGRARGAPGRTSSAEKSAGSARTGSGLTAWRACRTRASSPAGKPESSRPSNGRRRRRGAGKSISTRSAPRPRRPPLAAPPPQRESPPPPRWKLRRARAKKRKMARRRFLSHGPGTQAAARPRKRTGGPDGGELRGERRPRGPQGLGATAGLREPAGGTKKAQKAKPGGGARTAPGRGAGWAVAAGAPAAKRRPPDAPCGAARALPGPPSRT